MCESEVPRRATIVERRLFVFLFWGEQGDLYAKYGGYVSFLLCG